LLSNKSNNLNVQIFNQKYLKSNVFTFIIFLITLITILPFIKKPGNLYFIELGIEILVVGFLFVNKRKYINAKTNKLFFWVNLYLSYNLINFIRGVIVSENYWDYKNNIQNSLGLFVPLIAYFAIDKTFLQLLLKKYISFSLPLFFVFISIMTKDTYGWYLVPISFLALFWPVLKKPWNYIIIIFSILIIISDLGARSNVIKFFIPLLLGSIFYFKKFVSINTFEILRKIIFIAPFILLFLGTFSSFNIFKIGDLVNGDFESETIGFDNNYKEEVQVTNLKDDTRSSLYEEVLYSANKLNFWFFGRSPARGNISFTFGEWDPAHRNERSGNEVCILNIFVWTGIFGVLIYLFVFYKATYLAINQSNNIFSTIMGIYVTFRWIYAWVEDMNFFNWTNIFVWIALAFCYSNSFRNMTNQEIIQWINGVFDFKKKV